MLNDRAKEIHAFIQRRSRERGSAPTIREIGQHFSIASTNGVRYYLTMLEKAGYIVRVPNKSRGIASRSATMPSGIPLLGRVAAGEPILAEESNEDRLQVDEMFGQTEGLFALKVRGDSMIDAGILNGDFVIVRKQETARAGQIVVALIEDEATVKRYQPKRDHIELVAENPRYEPIVVSREEKFQILGTVCGVVRTV